MCNYFYPIHCQKGEDQEILRLHSGGENISPNCMRTDLATSSVQLAGDCFRIVKTINQFRRLCRSKSPDSLPTSESSTRNYSSISVIETAGTVEGGSSSNAEVTVHEDCDNDENEEAYICGINANDHYRPCKARAPHSSSHSLGL